MVRGTLHVSWISIGADIIMSNMENKMCRGHKAHSELKNWQEARVNVEKMFLIPHGLSLSWGVIASFHR